MKNGQEGKVRGLRAYHQCAIILMRPDLCYEMDYLLLSAKVNLSNYSQIK